MSPRRLSLILVCFALLSGIAGTIASAAAGLVPVGRVAPVAVPPAVVPDVAPTGVANRAASTGIALPRTSALYLFTNHPAIRSWTSLPRRT